MATPKINTAFTFRVPFYLGSTLVASPPLAAGDAVVYTAGVSTGNLNTLTSVAYGADCIASATQMNGADVLIQFADQTVPRAWDPFTVTINLDARNADDLAFPATSGRSMVVDAAGLVDANAVKVGPTGAGTAQTAGDIPARLPAALDVNGFMKADVEDWKGATAPAMTGDAFARLGVPVGASTSADIAAVQADTDNIQTRLPAALVGGRMDSSVGAMAAGVQTTASFAAGAIDNTVIATNVITSIVAALLAGIVEGTITVKQALQVACAALAAKMSGLGTGTVTARNMSDTADAIVATVDASGNRSNVTRTFT